MAIPKIKMIEVNGRIRYRAVVDVGTDPITGKRKQKTITKDLKRELTAEVASIRNAVNTGTYVGRSEVTVDDQITEYLRSATRGKEPATKRNYEDAFRPVRERLGKVKLQKLTTAHLEDFVDWMLASGRRRGGKAGTGLSPRTVQLTLSRLKAMLDDAVHRRLIPFNPAAPVKCPAQTKTSRTPWTEVEVKTFISSLAEERLLAVMLLSLMGLRPAEVCGVRWSDIDLDEGTLKVANTRTLVAVAGPLEVIEKAPKTVSGRRLLPLPAPVVAALRTFKATQAGEKLATGPEVYQSTGYVLVDELGEPQRTDWLRRKFKKFTASAKVRPVRLYDARHATLTYLAMNGVPAPIVSAWAGHSDLSLAQKVYVHPSAEDLRQGSEALTKLLG